jgi:hypothetical protein
VSVIWIILGMIGAGALISGIVVWWVLMQGNRSD